KPSRRVRQHSSIQGHVMLEELPCRKTSTDALPATPPIQRRHFADAPSHVSLIGTNETGAAMLDDLGYRAFGESQYRRPTREGFDHDETEWFRPPDRVDER